MNKQLMTNLVNTLTKYKDGIGEHDRAIFETFLYGIFDEKNRRYTVIQHLPLLAEVLMEKRRVDLVDDITFANHNAAYELDVHLKELQNERI
ncbi:hypothetical protein [Priestia megaterium]|uniref:hypothetical protein n=1 Tax=Priestia megaterium TaxID=1404 RepID=UPI000BA79030|nr:hypothetical protein [Priestia megaterium]PAK47602.1 hypothetical protein CHH47_19340 [Priestia megaterium]